jgi:peroxiredoxin
MQMNKLRRIILLLPALLLVLLITDTLYAGTKGYKLTVRLQNSSDTALLLAHYMGSKQYLDDTAFSTKNGLFVFEGNEKLKEGMYLVAGQSKTRYFDFFLTGTQQMEFSCDPAKVTETMKVKGSEENARFYAYVSYLGQKQKEIEPCRKWLSANKKPGDSLTLMQLKVNEIDTEVKSYISTFITNQASTLAGRFIKANNETDIRPFITRPDGSVDSSLIYRSYKNHYFDNLDFSDPRLIYTPVFTTKVDYYLDKLVVPTQDSLEAEIDRLMNLASVNRETNNYMAWHLIVKYSSSEVMGHDALYVYVIKKYLEPGKADWLYPEVKEREISRANTLEPLLLGKPAPNLVMLDTLNNIHSLYNVKARYTIVFFWESTCGHCQKEMPDVLKFYDEFHLPYDLEIFGVSGDTSLVKWKAYIAKNKMQWINVNGHLTLAGNYHDLYDIHSTPVMYLLDENKKILAKFLLPEQLRGVIKNREEALKKEKLKTQ